MNTTNGVHDALVSAISELPELHRLILGADVAAGGLENSEQLSTKLGVAEYQLCVERRYAQSAVERAIRIRGRRHTWPEMLAMAGVHCRERGQTELELRAARDAEVLDTASRRDKLLRPLASRSFREVLMRHKWLHDVHLLWHAGALPEIDRKRRRVLARLANIDGRHRNRVLAWLLLAAAYEADTTAVDDLVRHVAVDQVEGDAYAVIQFAQLMASLRRGRLDDCYRKLRVLRACRPGDPVLNRFGRFLGMVSRFDDLSAELVRYWIDEFLGRTDHSCPAVEALQSQM